MHQSICALCGIAFEPKRKGLKYCGTPCQQRARYALADRVPCSTCAGPTGYKLGVVDKATCNNCRRTTWVHGTSNSYKRGCRCVECRIWNKESHRAYVERRQAGLTETKPCSEPDCTNASWSRKLCRMHYKRWARANGMERSPSDKWSDTRRSNYHARRARMNGARNSDRVLLAELLLRDHGLCAACEGHVDTDIPWPDPFSPSVDHTIPLSKGGEHTMANTTVMHLRCNMAKGARLIEA